MAPTIQEGESAHGSLASFERFNLDVERFAVCPPVSSEEVSVGVAIETDDQIGRLQVVTARYAKEGYLDGIELVAIPDATDLDSILSPDGLMKLHQTLREEEWEHFLEHGLVFETDEGPLYIDKYHWSSIPIVAVTLTPEGEERYIASSRIILKGDPSESNSISLPIFDDESIELYDDDELAARGVDPRDVHSAVAEFSQFAKAERLRGEHRHSQNGILRVSYLVSESIGVDVWLATIDSKVVRFLNGFYIFELPKIGDPVDYLGSSSEPVLIVTNSALTNAAESTNATDTSRWVSQFIRGNIRAPWYTGV